VDRKIREGFDLATAFAITGKRLRARGAATEMAPPPFSDAVGVDVRLDATQERPNGLRRRLKDLLRPIGHLGIRLAKPILRPLAYRLRRYLVEEVQNCVVPALLSASSATTQELRDAFALELKHTSELISLEIQNSSVRAEQHVQVTRDWLRTELESQNSLRRREIDAFSFLASEIRSLLIDVRSEGARAHFHSMRKLEETAISVEELKSCSAETAPHIAASASQLHSSLNEVRAELSDGISQSLFKINEATTALERLQALSDSVRPRIDLLEQYSYAAARRVAINCSDETVLIRTEVGFVLCASADHALLAALIENGDLEAGTRRLIQKLVKPGDTFIDAGANIGMHTLAAARAMNGCGRIIVFEPYAPTMRLLERTLWMNGYSSIAELHQIALSNRSGQQRFFLGPVSGHHSLFQLEAETNLNVPAVDVRTAILDDLIAPRSKIDLVKIDVEGAEYDLIAGGSRVISENPNIALIVEFGLTHLQRSGHTPTEWIDSFSRMGLIYKSIDPISGALLNLPLDRLEHTATINLLFARNGSTAWTKASA
jgi:FkbM family methyltransferase